MSIHQKSSYQTIIDLSQSIRKIQADSFQIKLQSMNSIIGLKRNRDNRSGFAAVSNNLIDFSNQMNEQAEILSSKVDTILLAFTHLKKNDRRINLLSRAKSSSEFIQKLQDSKKDWVAIIQQSFLEIDDQITKAMRICKLGNVVVIFSKVEAAYMSSDSEIYDKLSEDIGNAINSIIESFKNIKENLGKSK
jgi:hypothetical protein